MSQNHARVAAFTLVAGLMIAPAVAAILPRLGMVDTIKTGMGTFTDRAMSQMLKAMKQPVEGWEATGGPTLERDSGAAGRLTRHADNLKQFAIEDCVVALGVSERATFEINQMGVGYIRDGGSCSCLRARSLTRSVRRWRPGARRPAPSDGWPGRGGEA